MATLQIEVSEREKDQLRALETNTGKSQDELLHLALARLFTQEAHIKHPSSELSDEEKLARLRAACGMWADHKDLPDDFHSWRVAQERCFDGWH